MQGSLLHLCKRDKYITQVISSTRHPQWLCLVGTFRKSGSCMTNYKESLNLYTKSLELYFSFFKYIQNKTGCVKVA